MNGSQIGSESVRPLWSQAEVRALYELPFNDLLYRDHSIHRQNFDRNKVQLSRLLSIKTGGCPEIAAIAASRRITKAG